MDRAGAATTLYHHGSSLSPTAPALGVGLGGGPDPTLGPFSRCLGLDWASEWDLGLRLRSYVPRGQLLMAERARGPCRERSEGRRGELELAAGKG